MVTRSVPGVVEQRPQGPPGARRSPVAGPSPQQAKRLAEICSPWQGRQSPASAAEEIAFVEDLLDLLGGEVDVEFERRDVTVLVTALRSGLSVPQVRSQAPGIDPSRLLSAYREVDRRRSFAERAWAALEQDGTTDGVMRFGELASQLLPAVITRLAAFLGDEERFRLELAKASDQVARTTRRVKLLEERVEASADEPERARELGTLLFDVYGHGAWSLETYLPPRVGTLVPLRLAALLGEDITAQRRMS